MVIYIIHFHLATSESFLFVLHILLFRLVEVVVCVVVGVVVVVVIVVIVVVIIMVVHGFVLCLLGKGGLQLRSYMRF